MVCHSLPHWTTVLSELFPITHPSWVALHTMAYSSNELHMLLCTNKAVIHEGETPIWGDNLWAGFDLESHEACATLQDTTDKVRPD